MMCKNWIVLVIVLLLFDVSNAFSRKILFMSAEEATLQASPSHLYAANYYSKDSIVIYPTQIDEFIEEDLPARDFVFYVHGYGKELNDVIERAQMLQELYNVQVVFLYWNSKNKKGNLTTLTRARKNMEDQFDLFQDYLHLKEKLQHRYSYQKYVLFTHSLGGYFIELLGKEASSVTKQITFDSIIINSAAIRAQKHSEWIPHLNSDDIVVVYNKKDALLRGLRIFTRLKSPLGIKAFKNQSESAQYIDMTDVVGFRKPVYKTHSYFTGEILNELPEVFMMYNQLLHAEKAIDIVKNDTVNNL